MRPEKPPSNPHGHERHPHGCPPARRHYEQGPRQGQGALPAGVLYTARDMAPPIVLATCAAWPELSARDRGLAHALRERGHQVVAAPWTGPFLPSPEAGAMGVRSPWAYHQTPDAYRAWLARLPAGRTFNAPELIRWNLSKAHILDLGARGAPVPRSRMVAATPA